ncbi:MAG: DUF1446 domain-containing protein [Actinomycetia bacterium]|nr:DUF1446 domain-containing protein [Actinomycetes bacterium]
MARPIRIANASGFYGDRFSAMREQVIGGDIDVVTGDYLAELTMFILWKTAKRGSTPGYAISFLRQMEQVLGECVERGIKIVTNAGGLDPASLAIDLRVLADELKIDVSVAHIEGDDLVPRLGELVESGHRMTNVDTGTDLSDLDRDPITANVYLGGWGITEALTYGADVVICPRVTDASLVVGPAAWHHGWQRDDWDRLAGAVVAGHVLECGAQATGGNFAFFKEIEDLTHPGFPIAEVAVDGSSVITKHDGTGGAVTVDTVTAQILYEIDEPAYRNPDVVAHFDTISLDQVGDDRVRITGVRGSHAPHELKVALNYVGGYRNSVTLGLVGLDVEEKAKLVEDGLMARLKEERRPQVIECRLAAGGAPDADTNEGAASMLTITAMDDDPIKVGRRFANAIIELALASYPGFFATTPPSKESAFGVYWPAMIARRAVTQEVVLADGRRIVVPDPPTGETPSVLAPRDAVPATKTGPTISVPLGTLVGARSGDKGGNANIGVWARNDDVYRWLSENLTVDTLGELLPEVADLDVERYELPNVRGLNFTIHGLLGKGVASSTRFDPQAKSLGEWLRSRHMDIPESLLLDRSVLPEGGTPE